VVVPITNGTAGAPQVVAGTSDLGDVSCISVTTCVAVGQDPSGVKGVVVPIINGTAGTPQVVAGTHGLGGVACGSATTCEAVGQNITAQGDGVGVVVPITNGIPGTAQTAFGTVTLNDVSCPSSATCVALGGNITAQPGSGGVVVPITDGAPGAAQAVAGIYELNGVACTTTSMCEAVGSDGFNNGRAVPIVNGVPGDPQTFPGPASLADVSCPATTTCQAVGQYIPASGIGVGVVMTFDPGAIPPVKPTPVVTLSSTPNAGVGVPGVLLTATVAPGDAAGTITFSDGSAPIPGCSAVPVTAGTAHCVTIFTIAGTHHLVATYSGDIHYAPASASAPLGVTADPTLFQVALGYLIAFAHYFHLFGL